MIKNYFLIAWRNVLRNKILSVIKIAGLSIGLAVCMLIILYTKDEISYDRFHERKGQIYRITQTWQFGEDAPTKLGVTNMILGESFKKDIPEVTQFVRISGVTVTVKKDNTVFSESSQFVDSNFFSVFSFSLLQGDPATALQNINSVVLTEEVAKKYYGTVDVIGKTFQLKTNDEFDNFVVTGLAANVPQNSTIKYTILLPFEYYQKNSRNQGHMWLGGSLNTFLLLSPKANIKAVEGKMNAIFDKNTKDQIAKAKQEQGISLKISLRLQPLTDIHLNTSFSGLADPSDPIYSYILTSIAIFILIIASINFINLAIAQSLKRSKEIGIRKVVGSNRKQLIKQFLIESFVVSLIAFVIAICLTAAVLPFFNELAGKKLSLSYLTDANLLIGYILLLIVTTFIAGFYPSLVLSAFQPVKVLYSKQKLMGRNYLTKSLIVLQFALAVFLIIGTIAINSQLNFLLHQNLGYNSKNLVRISLPFSKESDKLPIIFKNELAKHNSIVTVAARNGGTSITAVKSEGKQIEIDYNKIDNNFFGSFQIPIIAGRNFSPDFPSDSTNSAIVNESFVKSAGWNNSNAVGKSIGFLETPEKKFTIIGVIKDYHFRPLKVKITPQLFTMDAGQNYGELWIKIRPDNIPQTLSLLESTYKKILPFYPYEYQFTDDINAQNYQTETKWKQIISISSILFIFISCIGLFGLVFLSIEQRTKEIGIRKVLGAAVSKILVLISKDFLILIAIAFVVAVPLGYYAVSQWLQNFAYRIHIQWWMFAIAGIVVIALALITMSFQAIKAAIANPVKSLRTE